MVKPVTYKTILLSVKKFLDLRKSSQTRNSTLKSRHEHMGYVFKNSGTGISNTYIGHIVSEKGKMLIPLI